MCRTSRTIVLFVVAMCFIGAPCARAGDDEGAASVLRYLLKRAARPDARPHPVADSSTEPGKPHRPIVQDAFGKLECPPREPMKAAITHVRDDGDLVIEEVIYHWAGSTYAAGHVVRLRQPKQAGTRMPALIVCPGDLAHYTWLGYRDFVDGMARAGLAVLFIEDPRIGKRHAADAGLYAVAAASGMPMRAIQTFDALRGLDYLLTRSDVDPGRIGIIGFAAGAEHAWLAHSLDTRIQMDTQVAGMPAAPPGPLPQIASGIVRHLTSLPASSAPPLPCGKPGKSDFKVMNYLRGRIAEQAAARAQGLQSQAQWESFRQELARWLEGACGLKTMQPGPAKVIAKSNDEGLAVETINLAIDAGLNCPAVLVHRLAAGSEKGPGVILSHDARLAAGAPEVQGVARQLAAQGYWVLAPDHVSVHPKSRRNLKVADVPGFFAAADRAGLPPLALRVAENLAAFRYLAGRAEVDPARIVIGGGGIGAIDACLSAVLENRIAGMAAVNVTTMRDWAEKVAPEETTFVHTLPYLPGMLAKADLDDCFATIAPRPLVLARLKEGWPKSGFDQVAATAATAYRLAGAQGALMALGLRDPIDERTARLPEGVARQTAAVARAIMPAPPVPGVVGTGEGLRNRDVIDSASGIVWLFSTVGGEEQEFCDGGYRLDTWSFFNDNGPAQRGWAITPLILKKEGNGYKLTGIGKTRTNTGAGLQAFPFEVAQGSDQVGAGHFFGFYTGDPAGKPNAGVAEYNDDYQDRMIILTLDGGMDHQKLTIGQSYRENSRWPRAYSIQAVSKRK